MDLAVLTFVYFTYASKVHLYNVHERSYLSSLYESIDYGLSNGIQI